MSGRPSDLSPIYIHNYTHRHTHLEPHTTPHWTGSLASHLPSIRCDSSAAWKTNTDSKNRDITHKNRNDKYPKRFCFIPQKWRRKFFYWETEYLWTYFSELNQIYVVLSLHTEWHWDFISINQIVPKVQYSTSYIKLLCSICLACR